MTRGTTTITARKNSAKTYAIVAHHIRSGRIYYHPAQHCFKHGASTVLRGITSLLRARLWPNYRLPFGADSLDGGSAHRKGRKRGSRVGREVALWANAIGKAGAGRNGRRLPDYLSKGRIDPLTSKVMALCAKMELVPLSGEHPVGCVALRLATGVDCVLRDKNGKIVLMEIKCGMSACWNSAQGKMRVPLNFFPNSPRWQAVVQLAVTTVLYIRSEVGSSAAATSSRNNKLASEHLVVHASGAGCTAERHSLRDLVNIGLLALVILTRTVAAAKKKK